MTYSRSFHEQRSLIFVSFRAVFKIEPAESGSPAPSGTEDFRRGFGPEKAQELEAEVWKHHVIFVSRPDTDGYVYLWDFHDEQEEAEYLAFRVEQGDKAERV
jgi:hypothetical protein